MKPPVLILDDDPRWLHICCARLPQTSYTLEGTPSLPDALRRLEETRYPVVVCDLQLIGIGPLGGFELLDKARTISEYTEVVIITAFGDVENDARTAIAKGAYSYLKKPVSWARLDDCITKAIQSWQQRVEEMMNFGFLTDGPELALFRGERTRVSGSTVEPVLRLAGESSPNETSNAPTYRDFVIRADGDQVRVLESPAGEAKGDLGLDLKAARLYTQQFDRGEIDLDKLKQLGQMLFDALFNGPTLVAYARSLGEVSEDHGLRLKLQVDSAKLSTLPWELLYDAERNRFLTLSLKTPVIRYLAVAEPPKPLLVKPPLHILGITASPIDQPSLDVEQERTLLDKALSPLIDTGQLKVSWLDHATPKSLLAVLRKRPHILHYVGHGKLDPAKGTTALILEDEDQKSIPLDTERLAVLVRDARVRLVFWNACETAKGMAQSLVRSGISAAIGTRTAVTHHSALAFAREFYRALSEGWPVDAAVVEGRKAVMLEVGLGRSDWAVPALFMRSPNGILFRKRSQRAHNR